MDTIEQTEVDSNKTGYQARQPDGTPIVVRILETDSYKIQRARQDMLGRSSRSPHPDLTKDEAIFLNTDQLQEKIIYRLPIITDKDPQKPVVKNYDFLAASPKNPRLKLDYEITPVFLAPVTPQDRNNPNIATLPVENLSRFLTQETLDKLKDFIPPQVLRDVKEYSLPEGTPQERFRRILKG